MRSASSAQSRVSTHPAASARQRLLMLVLVVGCLPGCAVVAVAGATVGVAATVVGTAVDVTVGAAKLGGRAVGAIVSSDEE